MTAMGDAGYTISDLRKHPRLAGITYGQTQTRLIRLAEIDDSWASKAGKRGAWIVSPAGMEILVRLRELEEDGVSVDSALDQIRQETTPVKSEPREPGRAEDPLWLRERVVDLEAQCTDLRRERDRLLGIIEQSFLALPAPKSRSTHRFFGFGRRNA